MIIAFGHQRRRGKDTCAKFLETELRLHNPKFPVKRHSFATSLKQSCHNLYSWAGLKDAIYYENHPEERENILPLIGKSPRDIWMDFGIACRERVFPDTFAAKVTFDCLKIQPSINIITDLRFHNEYKRIKELDGICVKVIRPDLEIPTDPADTALNDWKDWDFIIENTGSLVDLSVSVQAFVKKFDLLRRVR